MNVEHTEGKSNEDLRQAKQLSLHRTKPPCEVPGYDVQRFLGAGAYGEVWVGVDHNTGRKVAVKFYLHRSGVDWTLLSREVEKLAFLSADRYVVQLLDVGWEAEPPFYVMEYVENGSLDSFLRQSGPMPLDDAVNMFREIAVGIKHAHDKGVLHCDIKPANILLDQDLKPRIADFGQSRLSNEQTPSLGTLFYMAPEQAQLDAVPDSHWDVYALGAMLYCMLTGEPPHRCEESISELDTSGDLNQRLRRYRELIYSSPPPKKHHSVPSMDRSLASIIDRCLSTEPERRFDNVQEVLHALDERESFRARRPLLLLGIVGPVMALMIMAFFSVRLYRRAMTEAENTVAARVIDTNRWIASHVAKRIEDDLTHYFELLDNERNNSELFDRMRPVLALSELAKLNQKTIAEDRDTVRDQFRSTPERIEMRDYLRRQLGIYLSNKSLNAPRFASMFVVDANGTMLAAAYDHNRVSKSVGYNYSGRTYFHGESTGTERRDFPNGKKPIQRPRLSTVFRSTTSGIWKVALAAPVTNDRQEVIGVLAFTVNLGDFPYIRDETQQLDQVFPVLIDGRAGDNFGAILQHPHMRARKIDSSLPELRVSLEMTKQLLNEDIPLTRYRDPMRNADGGEPYNGDWLAAAKPVVLPNTGNSENEFSDLIVLVQESYGFATDPLFDFGRLVRDGLLAFCCVIVVVGILWWLVARSLRGSSKKSRDSDAGLVSTSG